MADFTNSTTVPEILPATFMERLLEPLPAADLVDVQYNLLLRRARNDAWRKADAKTKYLLAKWEMECARDLYRTLFYGDETCKAGWDGIKAARQARAEQILTPAPDQAAVRWKKNASKDRFLPIDNAKIERAIAEDEAWLAAHPAKRAHSVKEAPAVATQVERE